LRAHAAHIHTYSHNVTWVAKWDEVRDRLHGRSLIGWPSAISQFVCNSSGPSVLQYDASHEVSRILSIRNFSTRLYKCNGNASHRFNFVETKTELCKMCGRLHSPTEKESPTILLPFLRAMYRLLRLAGIHDVLRIPRMSFRCYVAAKYRRLRICFPSALRMSRVTVK